MQHNSIINGDKTKEKRNHVVKVIFFISNKSNIPFKDVFESGLETLVNKLGR
jgi:hypothetical protein